MIKLLLLLCILSFNAFAIDPMASYETSNIKDESLLNTLFKQMHRNKRNSSECYERAHVWSFQMLKNHNINSQKVFIYFTRKYNREIFGQWWFHVAPAVNLNNELYLLDPEFISKAVPFEAWKNGAIDHAIKKLTPIKINYENEISSLTEEKKTLNLNSRRGRKRLRYIDSRTAWLNSELERMLIKDTRIVQANERNWPFEDGRKELVDIDCPIITNYSDYKKAQEQAYCYIQMSNMYVWEPSELEKLETKDQNKTEFVNSEIYTSYKKAFKGRFPYRF